MRGFRSVGGRSTVAACLAITAVLAIPAAAAAPGRTDDYALLAVTAGAQGATGFATSLAMPISDTGAGPRVSAFGLGTSRSGSVIDAQEGGGGPIRLSTTGPVGGVSAQLSGPVSTLSPQPYKATLTINQLAAGSTVVLMVGLANMRFPRLHLPAYKLTHGSVRLRLIQGIGTVLGRVGDPTDGGVAGDVGPLGAGLQLSDFNARTGLAGAFLSGITQVTASTWTAPDGNTGRWVDAGSTFVGWPSFAGPPGQWHLDWAGSDVSALGNPVAFVYIPVGSYWRYFRCTEGCMYPAPLP